MPLFDLDALEALPVPLDKSELLARIPPARRALEDVIASLDDAQLSVRGNDGWTVRDHLSHIAAWERMVVAHLTYGNDHETAGLSVEAFAGATLNELNARLYELHSDDALEDVRAEFTAAHASITELIARLSEEDLVRPYWDDDPSLRPVIEKLSGDTYRHYLEHRRWISELVKEAGVRA